MRRAQLQSLEPILIVIMLGLLAGIGLLFYVKLAGVQGAEEAAIVNEREALLLMKRVANMPELVCPVSETVDTFCIDAYKAIVFAERMNDPRNQTQYFPVFGNAQVTLEWLDLGSGVPVEIELYNALAPDADVIGSSTYFTVHDPVADERMFAALTIRRAAR